MEFFLIFIKKINIDLFNMKKFFHSFILLALMISCQNEKQLPSPETSSSRSYNLWYKQPAEDWNSALPVGNGRIGGMIYGHIENDTIQLNEESLWAGARMDANNPSALEYLDTIRKLIFQDKNKEAFDLAEKHMLSTPPEFGSYETFGNLLFSHEIESSEIDGYKRNLNLNTGVHTTLFKSNDTEFQREVISSAADNLILIRFTSSGKNMINTSMWLEREKDATIKAKDDKTIILTGQIVDEPGTKMGPAGKNLKFSGIVKILSNDGSSSIKDNKLVIKDASEVVIGFTAFTDYNLEKLNFDRTIDPLDRCKQIFDNIGSSSYNDLKKRHVEKHRPVFERMEISLGKDLHDTIPTDVRLQNVKDSVMVDNDLMALYFQYGRYLLMGSSGFFAQLPANLQGIWNYHYLAPWNCDFHTNINIQMNYWPAEVCNLSETVIPYTNLFFNMMDPGAVTAKKTYGAKGWTMHHVTNPFGYTEINYSVKYGMFPMGASWVCFPVWRHYQFTKDTSFLQAKGWPMMKGACEFILDYLVESPEGYLVTTPTYSPENSFTHPVTREQTQLTYGPTMDIMIIKELFKYTLEASEILGTGSELKEKIQITLDKLPPVKVGADSTIQEWIKDYEEPMPWHRHISHLIALHPGTQITAEDTIFFKAARKTIEKRLKSGGGHTGWSRAWIINFYARLLDGDEAYNHIVKLFQNSTYKNLFDAHPPFQIDGNLGGTAGMAEMLVQSHAGYIHLMPSLPKQWDSGKISGIKARGNFTLDMEWNDSKITRLTIYAGNDGKCQLKYMDKNVFLEAKKGESYVLGEDFSF